MSKFTKGNRVVWTDPDGGDERTGTVKEVIDGDDAYLLDFGDGSETEAFENELRSATVRNLENITEENLSAAMEFDHVIRVHEDGTVSDGYPDLMAPDITMEVDADGSAVDDSEDDLRRMARSYGWELLDSWTGQCGYRGVVMHSSEYIGGGLADHILDTPGYYVAVTVECMGPDNDPDENENPYEPAGWAIAYRSE